jgi:hypothetical protein
MSTRTPDAATAFADLIARYSYRQEGRHLLTNVTFFVGAGFSKAWDSRSPTGNQLFTFTKEFIEANAPQIEVDELLTQPGYPTLADTAPAKFKELIYSLGMQLKYPGIRTRYMDDSSLVLMMNEVKALVVKRFEEMAPINYYDANRQAFGLPADLNANQQAILEFYRWLWQQQQATGGMPHGIHVDFLSTNYDYIIETILDNIRPDEGLLRNTYRGITPTHISGQPNRNIIQDYWSINTLLKINGGFEILAAGDSYQLDYRARDFESVKRHPPELMLPSREQNYTNPYFASIFPKAVRLLQESRILVIVGYSLSEEDALLRFLIRQFAEDLRDVYGKYIFYISPDPSEVLVERLQGCFRYLNYMDAGNIFAYSGGFTDWIAAVLAAGAAQG